MYGAHQAFNNTKVVVDNLYQWCQTVGGAGCVGNYQHILGIFVFVYANNKGWSLFILCRSGDNDLFSACFDVSSCFFGGSEYAGGFYNVLSAAVTPWNLTWLFAVVYIDCMTVDNKFAVFCFESTFELTVHGVILGHIYHVIEIDEWVIDAYNFKNFRLSHRCAKDQSADTSKTVDTNFNCHENQPPVKSIYFIVCQLLLATIYYSIFLKYTIPLLYF